MDELEKWYRRTQRRLLVAAFVLLLVFASLTWRLDMQDKDCEGRGARRLGDGWGYRCVQCVDVPRKD